jgi:membrane protein
MAHDAEHHSRADRQRGRAAEKPRQIPKQGWKDILKRTKDEIRKDHLTIVAAGVAFFIMVGIVPTIAALISIYGLVADPAQIQQQFDSVKHVMPAGAHQLLSEQMTRIASSSKAAGWGAALGILLALWGGSKAVKALIEGLNVAYSEQEKRGFVKLTITSLMLTLAGIAGLAFLIGLIAFLPSALRSLGVGETLQTIAVISRWPLLLLFFMVGLTVLYRYGPSRAEPRWMWVSWGALGATLLWLAASALFSLYVSNFGSYNKTYGSLGTIIILLMWLYLSAYAVLVGAELNAQLERQTARDITRGAPEPMGKRGAFSADDLGEGRSG